MQPHEFDLLVVGAGPAGSAAAIAALRENPGARVLVLDRSPLGRDKVCGDGIAPHAVAELGELGVIGVLPAEIVESVRLVSPGGAGTAAVTGSPGYVVPRAVFDERLARAAIGAGAEFVEERVVTVEQDAAGVTVNGSWQAPVLVGADGSNSIVRRQVGQPSNKGRALAVAIRGYAPTPRTARDEILLRWDSHRAGGLCYAWAFPTANGTTNVGYGLSSGAPDHSRAHLERRLRDLLPEYDLAGVELVGHTLPLTVSRPRASVGRVLLTGDAASLINPFTGEGIYSAIASGALAGAAAVRDVADAGRSYERALAERFGRQHRQMRLLYPLIDAPFVLDAVIRGCEADRRLFDRLLEVGLGDSAFRLRDLLAFGRYLRLR